MNKRVPVLVMILVLLIASAFIVLGVAAQDPGTSEENACYTGGLMEGKCNSDLDNDGVVEQWELDWSWQCGWYLAYWMRHGGWSTNTFLPTWCDGLQPPRPPAASGSAPEVTAVVTAEPTQEVTPEVTQEPVVCNESRTAENLYITGGGAYTNGAPPVYFYYKVVTTSGSFNLDVIDQSSVTVNTLINVGPGTYTGVAYNLAVGIKDIQIAVSSQEVLAGNLVVIGSLCSPSDYLSQTGIDHPVFDPV